MSNSGRSGYGLDYERAISPANARRLLDARFSVSLPLPRMGYEVTLFTVHKDIHTDEVVKESTTLTSTHRLALMNVSGTYVLASTTDTVVFWPAVFGELTKPFAKEEGHDQA